MSSHSIQNSNAFITKNFIPHNENLKKKIVEMIYKKNYLFFMNKWFLFTRVSV